MNERTQITPQQETSSLDSDRIRTTIYNSDTVDKIRTTSYNSDTIASKRRSVESKDIKDSKSIEDCDYVEKGSFVIPKVNID